MLEACWCKLRHSKHSVFLRQPRGLAAWLLELCIASKQHNLGKGPAGLYAQAGAWYREAILRQWQGLRAWQDELWSASVGNTRERGVCRSAVTGLLQAERACTGAIVPAGSGLRGMAGLLWSRVRQRCFSIQAQVICNLNSCSQVGLLLQPGPGSGISAAQQCCGVQSSREVSP